MSSPIDDHYVRDFLNQHELAVISTVDEKGRPHAAAIYFVMDDEFNFFFVTPDQTQKVVNLAHQNEVVLTVTDAGKNETAQVRGVASEDDGLLHDVLKKLAEKLNHDDELMTTLPLLRYKDQPKTVIKITPSEVRLRKYHPDQMEEKKVSL